MPFCKLIASPNAALRMSLLAALASGMLAGCSSSGADRFMEDDGSGGGNYTASVAPIDNGVQAAQLDAPQTSGGFKARPVVTGSYGNLPPPVPVNEPAPKSAWVAPKAPAAPQAIAPAPMQAPPKMVAGLTHKVKPGETIYSLGRTYQLKPTDIANANHLDHNAMLSVGQVVNIPAGGKATQLASAMPDANPAKEADAPTPLSAPRKVASRTDPSNTVTDESPDPGVDAPAATASDQPTFRWPVQGRVISGFGAKPGGLRNEGINISVPEGTPVRAAESGTVAYAGNELKGYGNLVLVRHDGGYVTAYAHNKELLVKRGDAVKRGDVIAKAGQTGSVESPQVHFEVRKGPTALDPVKFLGSSAAGN